MINISIGDKKYKVKEAKTEEEKEKGLQGVTELPEDEGMLFYFDEDENASIWMKDTLIPLDIIFINDDEEVVYVGEGVPETETIMTVPDVAYVLEVNKGSGIKEGDELDFEDDEGPVMKVLAQDGSTQMELWGGERIISRRETKILIKKSKKADLSKKDSDYKSLGRYVFKVIKGQDERPAEYVERKKCKHSPGATFALTNYV